MGTDELQSSDQGDKVEVHFDENVYENSSV